MCITRYMKKRKMGGEFLELPGSASLLPLLSPRNALGKRKFPSFHGFSKPSYIFNRDAVAVALMKESPTTITEGSMLGGEAWW